MFKKRKMNKQARPTVEETESTNKRIKTSEEAETPAEKSPDSDASDECLNLANVKKQMNRDRENNMRPLVASTIDERNKKSKIWSEKTRVLKSNGQVYKANRELDPKLQNAEDPSNFDTCQLEINKEAYERELRRIEISKGIKEGTLDPKVYRGQAGYASYFDQTEEDLKRKQFKGTLGPTKKDNFVKESTRMDYNPELCKDYFETGHCAFGDTCIFIHDRTDYASGHQLEKDWNDKQRKLHKKLMGKKYKDESDDDTENEDNISNKQEEVDDEGLPLKCKICNQYFKEPIVTKCNHYFCESCALKRYREDKSCFICQKHTQGIFNEADRIAKKLAKMTKEEVEEYRRMYTLDGGNDSNYNIMKNLQSSI